MDVTQNGARVDQTVKHAPEFAAKPLDTTGGRGNSQRNHENECHEREAEIPCAELSDVRHMMHNLPGKQVQAAIEEGKQAEHSAELNQIGKTGEPAKRGHRQRQELKLKCPLSCAPDCHLDDVCAESETHPTPSHDEPWS